jgi:ketosteroid isomerase-like protein
MKPLAASLALTLALAGCVGARNFEASPPASPAAVIAAERAFAARAGEIGWIPAFCQYSAADSQLIAQQGFANAHEQMCAQADDGGRDLFWAPEYAGIARSGDLGFTTGPASFDAERTPRIQYFTVWRRQADGSWKWIYDGGPGPVTAPGPYLAAGTAPATLPIAARGLGSAEAARMRVMGIEQGAADARALTRYLAPDAHVYRPRRARAHGGADAEAALLAPSPETTYRLVRTEASQAGDLVFTLGEASWTADGAQRAGYFARIWQYRPEGWRIVYDQLVMRQAPG